MSDNKQTSAKRWTEGDGHCKSGRSPDSRHSPLGERHTKHESKSGQKHSSNASERYDRNDRHHRRHDNRLHRDYDRHKRRDYDRRDGQRRDERSRRRYGSRSRSRSRSRERHSRHENSNQSTSRTRTEAKVEKVVNECKPEKGFQHKMSLEIMKQQIEAKTGITIPQYYNPGVINPIKFAEQEQKRKLLWSREDNKTKDKTSVPSTSGSNQWNDLKFSGEKGNEMTEKFRKLMGIKDNKGLSSSEHKNESAIQSQETLFRDLDMQYAIARLSTHTQRGVGLGFGGPQN